MTWRRDDQTSSADAAENTDLGEHAYEVGYGRPPKATCFQPGRSGNPRGRPTGSKNFNTVFSEELAQPVALIEQGKRRRIPKKQAIAKQLINKALGNDPKSMALVVGQINRTEAPREARASLAIDLPQNRRVIESIVRRIRMNTEPSSEAAREDTDEESK